MGWDLFDRKTNQIVIHLTHRDHSAVVEAVRSLGVLAPERVDCLYSFCQGEGWSTDEARLVGGAIRNRLIPELNETDRLLLEEFANCCETCNGFEVC